MPFTRLRSHVRREGADFWLRVGLCKGGPVGEELTSSVLMDSSEFLLCLSCPRKRLIQGLGT